MYSVLNVFWVVQVVTEGHQSSLSGYQICIIQFHVLQGNKLLSIYPNPLEKIGAKDFNTLERKSPVGWLINRSRLWLEKEEVWFERWNTFGALIAIIFTQLWKGIFDELFPWLTFRSNPLPARFSDFSHVLKDR